MSANPFDECCKSLENYTTAKNNVYGFDFVILLPLIIDILMSVIGNCGGDDEDAIQKIEKKSFLAKWAVRKAIRTASKQQKVKVSSMGIIRSSEDVLNWASENTSSIRSALKEVKEAEGDDFDKVWS